MSWNVHLHVCFPCNANEGVAELAKKHQPALLDKSDGEHAAIWFLDALSARTGKNFGPRGGLSLWGMVGNYTKADEFCESLKPFWSDLLSGEINGGPCAHERIMVFEEQEQTEAANVYEIGWTDSDTENKEARKLFIKKHERMPFSWQQF